jgi:hypothetical protein
MDHDGPMSWDPDHAGHEADEYGREPEGELPLDHSDVEPSGEPSYDGTEHDGDHPDHGQPDEPAGQHDGLGLEYADLSGEPGDQQYDDDTGHDDAHDAVAAHDEQDPDVTYAEPIDGSHPDLDTVGDHPGWSDDPFPPQLDLGEPPEPVDGFPWSDAAVLGDEHDTSGTAADYQPSFDQPPAGDLVAYDAQEVPAGEDPWRAMAGSDDPATSSLARFWGP